MRRSFTFIAVLVIVAATIAGGLSAKSARRRSASNSNSTATSPADKYEADRIENDYREAIATVEDRYAGDVLADIIRQHVDPTLSNGPGASPKADRAPR